MSLKKILKKIRVWDVLYVREFRRLESRSSFQLVGVKWVSVKTRGLLFRESRWVNEYRGGHEDPVREKVDFLIGMKTLVKGPRNFIYRSETTPGIKGQFITYWEERRAVGVRIKCLLLLLVVQLKMMSLRRWLFSGLECSTVALLFPGDRTSVEYSFQLDKSGETAPLRCQKEKQRENGVVVHQQQQEGPINGYFNNVSLELTEGTTWALGRKK